LLAKLPLACKMLATAWQGARTAAAACTQSVGGEARAVAVGTSQDHADAVQTAQRVLTAPRARHVCAIDSPKSAAVRPGWAEADSNRGMSRSLLNAGERRLG